LEKGPSMTDTEKLSPENLKRLESLKWDEVPSSKMFRVVGSNNHMAPVDFAIVDRIRIANSINTIAERALKQ